MPKPAAEQVGGEESLILSELSPVVAIFDWKNARRQFEVTGPLKRKMGFDEGVVFHINDNRRGIAKRVDMTPREIEGKAAVFGRLMLQTSDLVQIIPIVYATSPADRSRTLTGYREGVIVEFDGQKVEEGKIKIGELDHINWLEAASRATEGSEQRHLIWPSQAETGAMSGAK